MTANCKLRMKYHSISDSETLKSYLVLQDLRNAADRAEQEAKRLEAELLPADAIEHLRQALGEREKALRDYPDWMICKTDLAETHRLIGAAAGAKQ